MTYGNQTFTGYAFRTQVTNIYFSFTQTLAGKDAEIRDGVFLNNLLEDILAVDERIFYGFRTFT